jgi:hypothetical protein
MTHATDQDSTAASVAEPDTIRITLKLFALLSGYLPDGAERNQIGLAVPRGSTPTSVMTVLHLPPALCTLVFLNGVFVRVADRPTRLLAEGDVLAIWPPVAGG